MGPRKRQTAWRMATKGCLKWTDEMDESKYQGRMNTNWNQAEGEKSRTDRRTRLKERVP